MIGFRRKAHVIRALALASTGMSALLAAPAASQTMDFPQRFVQPDDFGVDLVTGKPVLSRVEGSIGSGDNALVLQRVWSGTGWQDNLAGKLNHTIVSGQEKVTLALGLQAVTFMKVNGVFVPENGDGSTLTSNANGSAYTFTTASGTVYQYGNPAPIDNSEPGDPLVVCQSSSDGSCILVPLSRTTADGAQMTFLWEAGATCRYNYKLGIEGMTCTQRYRLQKVSDNAGLEMNINYVSGTAGSVGWSQKSSVQFKRASEQTPASTVSYSYSGSINVTEPDGGQWNYQTDASYRLNLIQGPNSSTPTITYSYNAAGKVSQAVKDGIARNYTYTTDASGNQLVSTSGDVAMTVRSNPTVGRTNRQTDALGNVTTYDYDTKQRLLRTSFPEGNKIEHSYDARGNETETRIIAKPSAGLADIVTTAGYPLSCGNILTCNFPMWTQDALGNRTDYSYDPTHGQVTKIEKPAPTPGAPRPTTTYEYTAYTYPGQTVARYLLTRTRACSTAAQCVGSANETVTTYSYDTNLRKAWTQVAAGDNSTYASEGYQYDAAGRLSVLDQPLSTADDRIYYRYNAKGARTATIYPDPDGAGPLPRRFELRVYRQDGVLTNIAVGTTTTTDLSTFSVIQEVATSYDTYSRKVKDTVYAGAASGNVVVGITQYNYDSKGRPDCTAVRMNPATFGSLPASACTAAAAGPSGPDRISQTVYDANDRPVQSTAGIGTTAAATEKVGYTANGKVAWVEDANGNRTAYNYDGFDRLYYTQYPSTTAGAHAVNANDYEGYGYDARGLLVTIRDRADRYHNMSYDALGRMTSKVSPNGEPTRTMTYDLRDQLTSVSLPGDTHSFSYNALGQVKSTSNSWGNVLYQYDTAGRRTRMSYPDGFFVDYDYDATGNMTRVRENGAGSGIGVLATIAYDGLGRRTALTYGNGVTQSFRYDSAARLATIADDLAGGNDDVTSAFTYNPAGQIASNTRTGNGWSGRSWNGSAPINRGYTVNGLNQYGWAGPAQLGYDTRGNLTVSAIPGRTDTFGYSSENMMTGMPSAAVGMSYDPLGRLKQLTSPTSNTRFLYDGLDMIAEYDSNGQMTRRYVHGPGVDEPLVWYEGGTTSDRRFLLADERGSVVAVTNSSGGLIGTNRYDEYGIPAATNIGRFQYTGQTWLPEVGLYYYKARMYSPTLGRFMQTDPIGYADGLNWYNYVGSDPVNKVDPTGTTWVIETCTRSGGGAWMDGDTEVVLGGTITCSYTGGGSEPTFARDPNLPGRGVGGGGATAPTKPCPVGINERNYPIPPGYTSAGQQGNRFVRDRNGAIQMNPNYAAARANAQGVDKAGVFWDLATILFGSVTGGLFGEGVTAAEAATTAVGGATVTTGSELAKSDGC